MCMSINSSNISLTPSARALGLLAGGSLRCKNMPARYDSLCKVLGSVLRRAIADKRWTRASTPGLSFTDSANSCHKEDKITEML